jgi:ATP-dependent protease ClpP protease subunit
MRGLQQRTPAASAGGSALCGRSPLSRRALRCVARAARYDRRKPPPPDLPSLLFDQRIVYLGMPVSLATALPHCPTSSKPQQQCQSDPYVCPHPPALQLVPAVTELMVAELLYLEKQGATMPIEMLINSSGTTRQDGEIVRLVG